MEGRIGIGIDPGCFDEDFLPKIVSTPLVGPVPLIEPPLLIGGAGGRVTLAPDDDPSLVLWNLRMSLSNMAARRLCRSPSRHSLSLEFITEFRN
ncbi:hypothetical protein Taro_055747 [Colocasia esculenta]|uniref:Uncharacterized protein n=1 Tax=Colocasia esculenta TaxID=4460 RepID=A0A843XUF6_COLES|nr:hypothetical protein [Colocasia esculenta]